MEKKTNPSKNQNKEWVMTVSAYLPDQLPDSEENLEVCFCGRSNVGKSSLINALINRKNLARTSKQPGKTRSINFFKGPESFSIVDLPGYGYAKRDYKERDTWRKLIEMYLDRENHNRLIFFLVDLKRGMSDSDREAFDYLAGKPGSLHLILTKIDQIGKNKRGNFLKEYRNVFSNVWAVSVREEDTIKKLRQYLRDIEE